MVFKNGKEFGEDSILKKETENEQKKKIITMAENEMKFYQVCVWWEGALGRRPRREDASCIVGRQCSEIGNFRVCFKVATFFRK